MSRRYREERRGHGCMGFVVSFILILLLVAALLFFTTNLFDGVKDWVYTIFYPQQYTEQVEQSSREFDVDEELIYAVIRSESGFRAEVESHAGAVGLMQLMPSTFEWLQNRLDGEVLYPASKLTDPDINIRYGTYFLRHLLDRYDGSIPTAVAAYNAGTTTVDEWLEDSRYSEDGKTLTLIPYQETAGYVVKVQKAYEMYRHLYGDQTQLSH